MSSVSRPTTILLADDSAPERSAARSILEGAGYRVREVADGASAVEVALGEHPDLVLLDVVMPRLNGLAACRLIKSKTKGRFLPIMMLSSRGSVNARVDGLRSGADDYLNKPYDAQELCARVEALLRVRSDIDAGSHPSARIAAPPAEALETETPVIPMLETLEDVPRPPVIPLPELQPRISQGNHEGSGMTAAAMYSARAADPAPERLRLPETSRRFRSLANSAANHAEIADSYSNPQRIVPGKSISERADRRVAQEFSRAERYSDPLACLWVAVDGFARLVQAHGAAVGDELTVGVAEVVQHSLRRIDLVFDEEAANFLILLPNTHFPGALAVAERIIAGCEQLQSRVVPNLSVSVSVGISFFPSRDTRSADDLVRLVRVALEQAQGEGGGRICLYQHQRYIYAPETA